MSEPPVDTTAALAWVETQVGPVHGVRELTGGWTSTMLAMTTATGDELVLRLMTVEPWRTHGAGLTTRESEVQRMLAGGALPVPTSRALDADGALAGHPAHLMTLLPGAVELDRTDAASLRRLAETLAVIHAVEASNEGGVEVRADQSWAFEEIGRAHV